MLNIKIWYLVFALVLSIRCNSVTDKAETDYPDPKKNPQSPLMLTGDWVPANTHSIDFEHLPHLRSQHAMVSDVRDPEVRLEDPSGVNNKSGGVNQHNYLTYFDHKYWIMWSDGPGVEDRVGQRVKYATSIDGIQWTAPQFMPPAPLNSGPDSPTYNTRSEDGWRWISRIKTLWVVPPSTSMVTN